MLGRLLHRVLGPPVPPRGEVMMSVPKEVRDASHDLQNAVMRARYHIQKAEKELHPIEELLRRMREE